MSIMFYDKDLLLHDFYVLKMVPFERRHVYDNVSFMSISNSYFLLIEKKCDYAP